MLQCPRGYWPVLLGAGGYWCALVSAGVALAHLPLMIGGVLTLPVALTSLPPSARLAHVIASGAASRRGATAILPRGRGNGAERATADRPHGG